MNNAQTRVTRAGTDENRSPIAIHCDECRTEFYGELSTWWRVYTGGEEWDETCPGCGRNYLVILTFRRRRKTPRR